MYINLLKSKIHRAVVTEANLDYVGSITIDEALMEASDIIKNEKVQIADINNGNRFETYVIPGERGSGMICLNGATARLVLPGDLIIIMSYAFLNREEVSSFEPRIVFVNGKNKVIEIRNEEVHGEIKS